MAVCLVLVEMSTPPPASRAHALTRTQTHVFHRWIISVILLAESLARGMRAGTLDYRSAHLLQQPSGSRPGVSQGGGTMEGVSQLTLSTKGERSEKENPDPQSPL